MLTTPSTDLRALRDAARATQTALAMTLLPDAARSLARRLSLSQSASLPEELLERLRRLGVREVFVDDSLPTARTMAEARELCDRLGAPVRQPLLLASCPCCLERLSRAEAFSPLMLCAYREHARCRGLAVRSLLAARWGARFSQIAHVTVVGCAARKESYARCQSDGSALLGEEYVMTARELALWLGMDGKPLAAAPDPPPYREDAQTAGRLARVLTLAAAALGGASPAVVPALMPAGVGVWEGSARINGREVRFAQARGLENALRLLERARDYDVIEALACAGCV